MLLLLADGSQLSVTELPGHGPWTFLVVQLNTWVRTRAPPALTRARPASTRAPWARSPVGWPGR